ncbi:MAG: radical SAM protein [Turicibacter sp.]|nr:radical SAM protein [Turicibacter sp.]
MKTEYIFEPWQNSNNSTFTLFAALTHKCNLKCIHCFAAKDGRVDESSNLSFDDWKTIIDQLCNSSDYRLFFTGGEPLIYSRIFELAAYCSSKSNPIPMIVGTNATLITDSVAMRMVEVGIKEARVSLDGATQASHDAVRGKGSFVAAVSGIESLIKANIPVAIRTTLNCYNIVELGKIAKFITQLGISDWEIKHTIPTGRAKMHQNLIITSKQRADGLETVLDIARKNIYPELHIKLMEGTLNPSADIPSSISVAACPAGKRMMIVHPNGNVIPCGYLNSNVIGNLKNESLQSIRQAWERVPKRCVPESCIRCKNLEICKGGCPAYNFCESI